MAEEHRTPTFTELTAETHADLKMDPKAALKIAADQHTINLKMAEVAMAASSFPVFISRASETSDWNISAINSCEINDNLFVENDTWTGTYVPIGMKTYPFFVMRSPKDEKSFTIGIDEESDVFSKEKGEALFTDGKASSRLGQAASQLELEVKHGLQTYQFNKKIEEFGLIRPIDLEVHYQNGRINTLKGLNSIDEVALNELDLEKFEELRKESYLPAIYSILISIYQFNHLIKLHNKKFPENLIAQIKLEPPKEEKEEAKA